MKNILLACIVFFLSLHHASAVARVQEIKTSQGFTVWLVEEHSLPIINATISFVESGLAHDPAGKEGRTNLVASLLLEGAGDQGSKAFNEQLENDAIRMNIGAEEDALHATLQTLTNHKDKAFAMLADSLVHPRFDADAVERARAKMQVLLIEQSESPHYKLSQGWQESIYGNHPYARMGFGTKESLAALSTEDFRNYVQRYITRENVIISVVGDVSAADISALIDKNFREMPTHYAPDSEVPEAEIPASADTRIIAHDIPQSMIAFGFAGFKRSDADYIPAFIVNHMLGGSGLGSRLSEAIRVKRGLTYGVRTQLDPKLHAGLWRGTFSTKNAQVNTALATLKETLAEYVKNGTSESELADAKAYLTGSFVLDLSNNESIANFLTVMQIHKLGSDYLEKRNGLIEAVTPADIKRVSARLITPEKLRVVMVGKPEL